MAIRNFGFSYVKMDEAGDAGATGGQQNNSQTNKQNGNQNDNIFAGMWQTEPNKSSQQSQQPQPQQQQQPSDDDATTAFDNHVKNLNLVGNLDVNALGAQLQEGKMDGLVELLNQMSSNVYKAALSDAQKLMSSETQKAIDQAVNRSTGVNDSKMLIKDLNSAVPMAADPEFAPIAQSVMTQFIKKGKSQKEAIELVGKFFDHIGSKVNAHKPPPKVPGNSGFNNTDTVNWEEVWTGLSEQN